MLGRLARGVYLLLIGLSLAAYAFAGSDRQPDPAPTADMIMQIWC